MLVLHYGHYYTDHLARILIHHYFRHSRSNSNQLPYNIADNFGGQFASEKLFAKNIMSVKVRLKQVDSLPRCYILQRLLSRSDN